MINSRLCAGHWSYRYTDKFWQMFIFEGLHWYIGRWMTHLFSKHCFFSLNQVFLQTFHILLFIGLSFASSMFVNTFRPNASQKHAQCWILEQNVVDYHFQWLHSFTIIWKWKATLKSYQKTLHTEIFNNSLLLIL